MMGDGCGMMGVGCGMLGDGMGCGNPQGDMACAKVKYLVN